MAPARRVVRGLGPDRAGGLLADDTVDGEAAYLKGGWAALDELGMPQARLEWLDGWLDEEVFALRRRFGDLRVLTAVSQLTAPVRAVLNAYASTTVTRLPSMVLAGCLHAGGPDAAQRLRGGLARVAAMLARDDEQARPAVVGVAADLADLVDGRREVA